MNTFDGVFVQMPTHLPRIITSTSSGRFSEQGSYDLTFTVDGEHDTDGMSTGSATFPFTVVPEPANAGLIVLACSLFYVVGRRRKA